MQLSQLHVQLSYQRRSKRFHCPRMSTLTLLTLDMNMHDVVSMCVCWHFRKYNAWLHCTRDLFIMVYIFIRPQYIIGGIMLQYNTNLEIKIFILYCIMLSGADPGFGIRGIVSRRGICGPLEVPSGSRAEP
jgi:hypothetical protein